MDDHILINETEAYETARAITDPVTRNLVMFGIAEARMQALRRAGQDESEWKERLPDQPFDMLYYYGRVLASMFAKTDILLAVLQGQDLAQASGWDV